VDELESLLNQIYGAVADPTRWPDVLVSVADHPDATSGMLVYQARSGGQSMAVLGRLSQELLDVYFKHYAWDVWSTAMKDKPVGHVLPLGSLVDNRALRRTAFYADVLAPKASKMDSPSTSLSWRATADSGDLAFIFPRAPRTPPNTIENGCSG
jgi:hypothetical protein